MKEGEHYNPSSRLWRDSGLIRTYHLRKSEIFVSDVLIKGVTGIDLGIYVKGGM